MSKGNKYKLLRGTWSRWDRSVNARVRLQPGDVVENVTPEEMKEHAARLQFISGERAPASVVPELKEPEREAEDDWDWEEILKSNGPEVIEYAEGLDGPDAAAMLASLHIAEANSVTPRKTVLKAIEARINLLTKQA